MAQATAKSKRKKNKIKGEGTAEALGYYRQMMRIRRFEERAAEMYTRGKIGGFLHLYIGEEAVAVGAISALGDQDYILSHYREHGHALARGMKSEIAMAELYGKATGCSKGKGGSMHLFDASLGFLGGSAIVGGQLPIAVGIGLASKLRENCQSVALTFFGDGAVQEGEFHEALNLAGTWNLPIVFFVENNGYAMGTPMQNTFAGTAIHERSTSYGIPGEQIDGMDLLAVQKATAAAVDRARRGEGPSLIEASTYRFRGHSMADPVEYRQKSEEEEWKQRDQIRRWRRYLEQHGIAEAEFEAIDAEIREEIDGAVAFAEESPFPEPDALFEDEYAPLETVDA